MADLVDLGLRFDLTVPLTRFYYGHNHANLRTPFGSSGNGTGLARRKTAEGPLPAVPYRWDLDIIGEPTVLAEGELIEATTAALTAVGLDDMTVRLSDRRFLTALAADAALPEASWDRFFTVVLDKLDKIGWDGVRTELDALGLPTAAITRALEVIDQLRKCQRGSSSSTVADALPDIAWQYWTTLLPPPTAWTGWAGFAASPGVSTRRWSVASAPTPARSSKSPMLECRAQVAGGGRYDQLIGRTLGRDVPACGFSIGFERIISLVQRAENRSRGRGTYRARRSGRRRSGGCPGTSAPRIGLSRSSRAAANWPRS